MRKRIALVLSLPLVLAALACARSTPAGPANCPALVAVGYRVTRLAEVKAALRHTALAMVGGWASWKDSRFKAALLLSVPEGHHPARAQRGESSTG